MKARLIFNDLWEDMEVQFFMDTELEFVPPSGIQFNFAPEPFELFVDTTMWFHNEGLLIVMFNDCEHTSKEHFIDSIRAVVMQDNWKHQTDKRGGELIDTILKGSEHGYMV